MTQLLVVMAMSFLLTEEAHGFRLSSYRYDPTLLSRIVGNSSGQGKLMKAGASTPLFFQIQRTRRQLELLPSRRRRQRQQQQEQQAEHVTTHATMPWLSSTRLRGGATVLLTATTNPAVSSLWLGPALACALAYALYNLFIKKASASMDPLLGGVLLQMVAATLGAVLLAVTNVTSRKSVQQLATSRRGVTWAMCAGVAVGAAEILSFVISSMGVPASKSIPTIVGGSVVLGTVLGAVWLGEQLSLRGWLGIVLIAGGIALVGMDPGSSLH